MSTTGGPVPVSAGGPTALPSTPGPSAQQRSAALSAPGRQRGGPAVGRGGGGGAALKAQEHGFGRDLKTKGFHTCGKPQKQFYKLSGDSCELNRPRTRRPCRCSSWEEEKQARPIHRRPPALSLPCRPRTHDPRGRASRSACGPRGGRRVQAPAGHRGSDGGPGDGGALAVATHRAGAGTLPVCLSLPPTHLWGR